jgi:NADPH-dependent 2,4-dienoyl-CoA reductase/sulfur reductase-like enzyme
MPGVGTIVIAGASLAGATAAETLRAEGFDGSVVAGMNVNISDVAETIERLGRSASPVDEAALIDPDVALETLSSGKTW